ncbi:MAG: trimeric intracellular cation channel family protein, partial [Silicimonas sp.]|nr:trimeric intracellular cation channel family protein [Silicimonas sp.]
MTLIAVLAAAAVFVFALSGALAASRAQLDIVGFLFFAAITAVGGGTMRDLLLDRTPFWIDRPSILLFAAFAAVAV